MQFTRSAMTARYHELVAQKEAIVAVSGPLRQARDDFANQAREQEQAMNAEIAAAEVGLVEIDQELAFLARGLGRIDPLPAEEEAPAEV